MGKEDSSNNRNRFHKTQPVRLYQKGVFTGYKRCRIRQHEAQAIVHIEHCQDKSSARWYMGKRVAYIYKVKNTVNNTRYRVRWGKVINTHGAAGAVRARFSRNLPPKALGATVRVMLYPNKTV